MAGKPIKALVLEDRLDDVELMLRALHKGGFAPTWKRVDNEQDYRAALDESWDVILADFAMPQFDASRALDVLHERGMDIPFLVITGSISEEAAVSCMKQGATDYLLKDRLARLGAAVEHALQRHQLRLEQRRVEAALRLTQHAVDHSPVAVFRVDLQGRIIYANHAARHSLGYAGEELLEMSIPQIDPTWTHDTWDERSSRIRHQGAATFESIHRRKDGTQFPVEVSVSYLEFSGNAHFFCFVTDLSERKRTHALLLESEKLRTVAGLAAGVAHEINNPLAGMIQNAQAIINRLSTDLPANERAAERHGTTFSAVRGFMADREIGAMLESIRSSGSQASRIVQNLLAHSRRDAGMASANLADVVEKTLELAANDFELKKGNGLGSVEIVREYADHTPSIPCYGSQLQQVLLNLIRNSIQAMRDNPPERRPRLRLRTSGTKDRGCIEVEDNGPGIAPELRAKLFEPFVSTKPIGGGTGLGLFVSYHLITTNHRGQITVESTPGVRTCFTILLPAHKSA